MSEIGKKPSGELTEEEMAELKRFYAAPDVMIPSAAEGGQPGSLRDLIDAAMVSVVMGLIPHGWAEQVGPDAEGGEAGVHRSARLQVSVKLSVQEGEERGPELERMADVALELPERYVKYMKMRVRQLRERNARPADIGG